MIDPDGTLDALTSLALVSPTTPKPKASNGASKPSSTISPNRELPSPGLNRPQASGEVSAITHKWKTGIVRIQRTGPLITKSLWTDKPLPVHPVCTPPFLHSIGMSIFLRVKLLKVPPVDLDRDIRYSAAPQAHTAIAEEEVKAHWSEACYAGLLPHACVSDVRTDCLCAFQVCILPSRHEASGLRNSTSAKTTPSACLLPSVSILFCE